MKIHMENEPKKGKVETTRNDRREKEKPNKTKRKANLKLVWLWLSWQGKRETEGGGGREGEGRTARRHKFPLLFFIVSFHANKLFNSTVWQLKVNYKAKQRQRQDKCSE